jgi:hypothetical protein
MLRLLIALITALMISTATLPAAAQGYTPGNSQLKVGF